MEARDDSRSREDSDPLAAAQARTVDVGAAHASTHAGVAPSNVVVATLDAGLARERTRQALFGSAEVEHKFNRYTVIDEVGAGAMGVVYSAWDPDLDRRIALKLMRRSRGDDGPESRERMIAEARAMAKVSHPNVLSVFEVGTTDSDPPQVFVAMEYVEGRTLRQWIREAKRSWREIVDVYAAAGRGLAAVHRAGLVHRDFKPENAMIDAEGRVRVMDFGLARDTDETAPPITAPSVMAVRTEELTRTGELVGTPAYMPPERFSGHAADPWCDQWAFCISLYEALWGKRPFVADSVGRLAIEIVSATKVPEPPSSSVPRRIRAAILRGLDPDPDRRWPSMDALVAALSSKRRNAWAIAWLGLGGVGLAAGWLLHAPASEEERCVAGRELIAADWGPERAAAVRSAFADALDTPSKGFGERTAAAVTASLDEWTEAWLAQHREACEATHVRQTQSDAMLDRRMRCLDRRRRELGALVDALGRADATAVQRAEDAVDGLVPPQRCGEPAFLDAVTEPPGDAEVAEAVDTLRGELAEIDAAQKLGRPEVALERARSLSARVEATEYEPLQAEHANVVGQLHFQVGDPEASRVHLEKAYFGARRARDAVNAASAALHLASLDITFGTEFDRGEHWLRLAGAEIEGDALTEAAISLADISITLHERRGELDLAIAEVETMLDRMTPDCADACEQLPEMHRTAAHLYSMLSRHDDAIVHARRSLELEEERHGVDHPHVAGAAMRLGDVLESARRYEEAFRMLSRALEIRERAYGSGHFSTTGTRVQVGVTLVSLGRADEGIAQLEQALGDARRIGEQQMLGATLNQLGWAYSEAGRHSEAVERYTASADIMRALHPGGHPVLAVILSNIATEETKLGDHEAALTRYEEALAMRRALVQGHDPQVATFLLNLARTLADLGRREEAVARAREAIEAITDEPLGFIWVGAHQTLADLLRPTDPAAADALLAEARDRCAAADAQTRKAASCDRVE